MTGLPSLLANNNASQRQDTFCHGSVGCLRRRHWTARVGQRLDSLYKSSRLLYSVVEVQCYLHASVQSVQSVRWHCAPHRIPLETLGSRNSVLSCQEHASCTGNTCHGTEKYTSHLCIYLLFEYILCSHFSKLKFLLILKTVGTDH